MIHPVEIACALQVQLICALRRVRAASPRWWSKERIQEAQGRDPECISLKAKVDAAWERAGGAA